MRPIIGITSTYADERKKVALNAAYVNAVIAAGGLPVIFPNKSEYAEEYLAAVDGVLFSGGGDAQGKYFGQPTHEKADGISEERDAFEISLARLVRKSGKPAMGICRGEQIINVAMGGDIIQHIEGHQQKDERNVAVHAVDIVPGTMLHKWLGKDRVRVNSFHHQIVDTLAPCFAVSARSEDGYIEAYEYVGDWFCACFQWHPEAMLESPEHALMLELFKPFIQVCMKK